MTSAIVAYLIFVLVMSVIGFCVYGFDKRRATCDGWRVQERTLHLLALFGGWPGELLGQRYFRHKTKKVSYLIVFWSIVVMHIAILGAVGYAISK